MTINMTELHMKVSYRRALPAVHSKHQSLRCNYSGTYACEWTAEKSLVVPFEGKTLDDITDELRKVVKPAWADAMKLETSIYAGEDDSDNRTLVKFTHDVDIDLHTYISPDGEIRIQTRPTSDRFGKSNDVELLKEAAKKMGVKVKIVNAIGSVL